MVFPLLAAGLNVAGGLAGLLSDKKKNKRAKEQLKIDRDLANQQIDISKYMKSLSEGLMSKGSNITDPYGSVTGYDAASGSYTSPLRPGEVAIQNASDAEELQRMTVDQEMRRRGLQEADSRRQLAGDEARQGIRDISLFKQGVGALDPAQLASSIRLQRQQAINAGYDDAERAATKLSLRTGSSSVSDALARIGRDRARTQLEGMGNPEIEGLQLAEDMNKSRLGQKVGLYDMYNTNANNVYDANFVPSNAADKAFDKSVTAQQLDIGRTGAAISGSGAAASGINSAAAGQRQGYNTAEQNRVASPTGNFLAGLGNVLGGASKNLNLASIFGG